MQVDRLIPKAFLSRHFFLTELVETKLALKHEALQ